MSVDMSAVRNVLMVRLSAIGDVVHTMPVAAALKRSFPHIRLVWAVEDRCAELVECNCYVDEVFSLPRHAWRMRRLSPKTWLDGGSKLLELRRRRFDLALDLQGLLKSAVVALASGAPVRLGYHWQREGARFLVKGVPPPTEPSHVVEQYLDVVRALGGEVEPVDFGLGIPDAAVASIRRLLRDLGVSSPYAVINPSAGHPRKRWPPERFAVVCERLRAEGVAPVLVGHSSDAPIAAAIQSACHDLVADAVGRTSLVELAALIRDSRLHIAGDTGSVHMAAALGVPLVALYAATDPARSGPYGCLSSVVSAYRPDGGGSLEDLSVDAVWERVVQHLDRVRSRV